MISYIFNAIINDYVRDRVKLKVPVIRVLCTAVRANVQFGVQQSEPMFSLVYSSQSQCSVWCTAVRANVQCYLIAVCSQIYSTITSRILFL